MKISTALQVKNAGKRYEITNIPIYVIVDIDVYNDEPYMFVYHSEHKKFINCPIERLFSLREILDFEFKEIKVKDVYM